MLFAPRTAKRQAKRVMNLEDVRTALFVLDLRERLIVRLAVVAGLRPGEIFALIWDRLETESAVISQRIYKGEIDTPKSANSVRHAALSDGLLRDVREWRELARDSKPSAWVFPSETQKTPIAKENCWRRCIAPRLKAARLGWVNFQVMRRTHSSLMSDLGIEPKVVADQLGHTVDVNQNVYTQTAISRRKEAVDRLESALKIS